MIIDNMEQTMWFNHTKEEKVKIEVSPELAERLINMGATMPNDEYLQSRENLPTRVEYTSWNRSRSLEEILKEIEQETEGMLQMGNQMNDPLSIIDVGSGEEQSNEKVIRNS